MKKSAFFAVAFTLLLSAFVNTSDAQQYKLRQSSSTMGMQSASTIYVKGMRKRTESEGMMGMPAPPITIEQCDLQRTIKINTKKKLYFIIPFSKETEEVIDEDAKPVSKPKPAPVVDKTTPKKGGTITMWYTITDTGERKKMNGFIARHIWTYQKIKPSPDACTMKDSIIMKTDGWYIDLPQFNCPERYSASTPNMNPEQRKPDCTDKFITRRKGKGKLGFPLTEKRTIIMGGGKTNEFETSLETLEFTSTKLDSMLFEIPPGFTLAAKEEDLQDKMDMGEMMNQYKNMNKNAGQPAISGNEAKKAGTVRVGVFVPTGDEQIQNPELQQYLAGELTSGNVEGVPVKDEEEARKFNCDYTLSTAFTKIKSGSKVGGLLKAIKNTDPNAASSFTMEATMNLVSLTDGSTKLQPSISGKFEGKIDDAARKALDQGSKQVLNGLK